MLDCDLKAAVCRPLLLVSSRTVSSQASGLLVLILLHQVNASQPCHTLRPSFACFARLLKPKHVASHKIQYGLINATLVHVTCHQGRHCRNVNCNLLRTYIFTLWFCEQVPASEAQFDAPWAVTEDRGALQSTFLPARTYSGTIPDMRKPQKEKKKTDVRKVPLSRRACMITAAASGITVWTLRSPKELRNRNRVCIHTYGEVRYVRPALHSHDV